MVHAAIGKAGALRLAAAIALCQMAGIIGSVFTVREIPGWFSALNKPAFTPPNWAFGPVWITLYTLMGISLYIVWSRGLSGRIERAAVAAFAAQLALNAAWSPIFFGMKDLLLAFWEILMLWAAIALTIALFFRISAKAGTILIPYIIWVTVAAMLNYSVWVLNP